MHDLLQKFSAIIAHYEIIEFDPESNNIRLKLLVTFIDQSILNVREYAFEGSRRKYSYHWQDSDGKLLIRWDNAPHWPGVETFPHHKHVKAVNAVEPSDETELEEVLDSIARLITMQ